MKESDRTLQGLDWGYLDFALQRFEEPGVPGTGTPGGTSKVCQKYAAFSACYGVLIRE